MRTRVKICGCTGVDDARIAIAAGADAIGVILAERSPRRVEISALHAIALVVPALVTLVAVFDDPSAGLVDEALKVGAIPQFHGDEPADVCEAFAAGPYLKAFHVDALGAPDPVAFAARAAAYEHATWLFDTGRAGGKSGGTGATFPWAIAPALAAGRPFVVSGGLTPENVGACVRAVRPFAVDVRSGVETRGRKDPEKVGAFVRAVREADEEVLSFRS